MQTSLVLAKIMFRSSRLFYVIPLSACWRPESPRPIERRARPTVKTLVGLSGLQKRRPHTAHAALDGQLQAEMVLRGDSTIGWQAAQRVPVLGDKGGLWSATAELPLLLEYSGRRLRSTKKVSVPLTSQC
jgi:hypothetical protein